MTIDRKSLAIVAIVGSAVGVLAAQGHPSHVIRNGEITARFYLPDATAGFYRSTRFDWSGAIASLQYKGHEYYGNWFAKITDIYDFGYDEATNDVISAEFTAMVGPAEEFGVIGYDEAKPAESSSRRALARFAGRTRRPTTTRSRTRSRTAASGRSSGAATRFSSSIR
jgi:hypothetical protein